MKIKVSIPLNQSQPRILEGSMFTVGRVEGNDIVIPNAKISSRHGRFVAREDALIFEDLNSRNGSLVEREGQRQVIAPEAPAILKEGDRLNYPIKSDRSLWLQIARGAVQIDDKIINSGDGVAITQESNIDLTATSNDTEILLFDIG